jgi:hypothetical protein
MLRLPVIKVEATHVERSQLVGLLHVKQYLSNARLNVTGIAFFFGEVNLRNVFCYPMEVSGY